jgi:oligopeptide/dipeptide ABC transporter ATP-binding protein
VLEARGLTVEYGRGRRHPPLRAVDDASFVVQRRETVALVGESGSGKTTIGNAILGLTPVKAGSIALDGVDITHAGIGERRAISADLQAVFQDPFSSLNPTRTIGQSLAEPLHRKDVVKRSAVASRVHAMLERVGLPPEAANRFPNHFSGGQRQRIAIARALMVEPRLVICDEPTSALDLSVQAQVLNLLRNLQDELELSYVFISHDLAVVRHVAHRIIVLYQGRIVEHGDAAAFYASPSHPYSRALLAAAPVPNPKLQRERRIQRRSAASVPGAPGAPEHSCVFASRCPHALDICRTSRPTLEQKPDRVLVACHRWRELEPVVELAAEV